MPPTQRATQWQAVDEADGTLGAGEVMVMAGKLMAGDVRACGLTKGRVCEGISGHGLEDLSACSGEGDEEGK